MQHQASRHRSLKPRGCIDGAHVVSCADPTLDSRFGLATDSREPFLCTRFRTVALCACVFYIGFLLVPIKIGKLIRLPVMHVGLSDSPCQ